MAMYRTELAKGPLMRASYAFGLFKPKTNDKGNDVYGATFILPKADEAGMTFLKNMIAECVHGQWGDNGVERFKKGLIKNPILDGAGKEAHDKDGVLRGGLGEDVVFIRPTSMRAPKVFNAQVMPASEDEIISGHWGYPVLNAFAWHNPKNGDGVSFGISLYQAVKVDEELSGGGSANPDDYFKKEQISSPDTAGAGGDAASMFD